jgi:hypothetical protein
MVARDLGEQDIATVFAVRCPAEPSPRTDYSADLFFRYLPGVADFIERLSPGDPLLARVASLAAEWPLSTPGMKLAGAATAERVEAFIGHAGLRRLYADRVLAAGDASRLGEHPKLAEALREAIGAHPELAPDLAEKLGLSTVQTPVAAVPH